MRNPWWYNCPRILGILIYPFIFCALIHSCSRLNAHDDRMEALEREQRMQSIRLSGLYEEMAETRTKVEIVRRECQAVGSTQSSLEDGDRIIMKDCVVSTDSTTSCRFLKQ